MRRVFFSLTFACMSYFFTPTLALPVTIPTVPVGNAGNANDPLTGNLHGGVSYDYRIGTTEVTNAQYVEFLNAKAASNTLFLYNAAMGALARGGITRSGLDGSYTYAPRTSQLAAQWPRLWRHRNGRLHAVGRHVHA